MVNMDLARQAATRPELIADWEAVINEVLMPAVDEYYNGSGESPLSDATYDSLHDLTKRNIPYHSFFTGIGAAVRGGKIDLPFAMGSLDQVQQGDLKKWIAHVKSLGVTDKDTVVITAKLDGASGCVIWDQNELRIAYSRGDGTRGADITRHMRHVVQDIQTTDTVVVRGENIISVPNFNRLQSAGVVRSSSGKPYRNPRNCVSGMMNAESNHPSAYGYVEFLAYSVMDSKEDKVRQLNMLKEAGFKVPKMVMVAIKDLHEGLLVDLIDDLRATYEYEIDGVVVEINEADKRALLDDGSLNPQYAFKFKTQSAENFAITTVCDVEWNVSKDGYLKPRVILEPCSLPGITCTHATGYNAAYIEQNQIGPGTVVVVSRKGDVVPNIVEIKKSTKAAFPEDVQYKWNETHVDIISTDDSHHRETLIKSLTDVATKLEVNGLKQGVATEIINHGSTSYNNISEVIADIIKWPKQWWNGLIGANGDKVYESLHAQLNGISVGRLLGAMPHFGRGVGRKKMNSLINALKITEIDDLLDLTVYTIERVEGFDVKTARKILAGIPQFVEMWEEIKDYVVFKETTGGNKLAGEKVCMTGFRDAVMQKFIEDQGGDAQSGVSSNTTILVVAELSASPSGKLKKAMELNSAKKTNIKIMTAVDFKKLYMENGSDQQVSGVEF